jgi:hypothetical protein
MARLGRRAFPDAAAISTRSNYSYRAMRWSFLGKVGDPERKGIAPVRPNGSPLRNQFS